MTINDNKEKVYSEEDKAILRLYNINPDTAAEKKTKEQEWYDKKYPDSHFNYSKGGKGPVVFYQFKHISNEELIKKYRTKYVIFLVLKNLGQFYSFLFLNLRHIHHLYQV